MEKRKYTREEIEQIRRIRKIKKRKLMMARIITGVVLLLLLFLLGLGIRGIVRFVGKQFDKKSQNKPKTTAVETNSGEDSKSLEDVYVPEGYEDYFQKLCEMLKENPEVEDVVMDISSYPEEFLQMLIDNVETIDYVKNYPEHKYDSKAGKIRKKEVKEGEIPLFIQWDERWGYLSYGNNRLAWNGCGPTSLSMVVVGLTGNRSYTPKKVAEYSEQNDYYDPDVGTTWKLMSEGAAGLGLTIHTVPLAADSIVDELQAGRPVICSMAPGDFTDYGHFIVLTGIDEDGKIMVNDPNSKKRSAKAWDVDVLVSQIKALWSYEAAVN